MSRRSIFGVGLVCACVVLAFGVTPLRSQQALRHDDVATSEPGVVGCSATVMVGQGQAEPASTGSVRVTLSASEPIRGLQMKLDAIGSFTRLELADCISLVGQFDCRIADDDGRASVIFVSLTAAELPAGNDLALFDLVYATPPYVGPESFPLTPYDVKIADSGAAVCPDSGVVGGLFSIEPCGSLGRPDSDEDGIFDDGDCSGQAGDYPCNHWNTFYCDDNCLTIPNPTQADLDLDGVGDACDQADLAVDFGPGVGLWLYTSHTGDVALPFSVERGVGSPPDSEWVGLSSLDPEGTVDWGGAVVADFGSLGLWSHQGSGIVSPPAEGGSPSPWTRLTGWSPDDGEMSVCGVIPAESLYAGFGPGRGLYQYDTGIWGQPTSWDPEVMACLSDGTLAVGFGLNRGLWLYSGGWQPRLTNWDPEELVTCGTILVADFGAGRGMWYWETGTGWTKMTSWDAEGMECKFDVGLAADFGADGFWLFDGSVWQRLSSWNAEDIEFCCGGLAGDFGANGLWGYDEDSGWSKPTSWNPEDLACLTSSLAVDFGAGRGLYLYDCATEQWDKINALDPQELTPIGVVPDQPALPFGVQQSIVDPAGEDARTFSRPDVEIDTRGSTP